MRGRQACSPPLGAYFTDGRRLGEVVRTDVESVIIVDLATDRLEELHRGELRERWRQVDPAEDPA